MGEPAGEQSRPEPQPISAEDLTRNQTSQTRGYRRAQLKQDVWARNLELLRMLEEKFPHLIGRDITDLLLKLNFTGDVLPTLEVRELLLAAPMPAGLPEVPSRVTRTVYEGLTPIALAVMFHSIYEHLAPSFGYETREETKKFDPESSNGKLMIAVCTKVLEELRK